MRSALTKVSQSRTHSILAHSQTAAQFRGKMSFQTAKALLKKIEQLPRGPEWTCDVFKVNGDQLGEDGKCAMQEVELWRRDPVECVRKLVRNPLFREKLRYEPQLKFLNEEGKVRVYDEMWTGDWWWNTQVSALF